MDQLVDHFANEIEQTTWTQRYFILEDHFRGPGSPIFVILGGEGTMRELYYAFVTDVLAPEFGAFVLQPEHRFYGESQPVDLDEWHNNKKEGEPDPRIELLTSEQALLDAMRLLSYTQAKLGCSRDRTDYQNYCPVITVGGSYPGYLSAMARLLYPDRVDMSYAASAPMKFYSQQTADTAYYQHIAKVADEAHAGCSQAVLETLTQVTEYYETEACYWCNAPQIGICPGTVPSYITNSSTFMDEINMIVGYTFANHNMAYYPPSPDSRLVRGCQVFTQDKDAKSKLKQFLVTFLAPSNQECLDMRTQVPHGPHATISAGDWSGVGTGRDGASWDFQTCTLLVETISLTALLPERNWTLEWMTRHCQERFGVAPEPTKLVQEWHWDDLVTAGASHILFTNGMRDGWSVSGIQADLSDTLVALNFPNGAHHSDLRSAMPDKTVDTEDLTNGFAQIQDILEDWIYNVHQENRQSAAAKKKQQSSSSIA